MKKGVLLAALLICLSCTSLGAGYSAYLREARECYAKEDYAKAAKYYEEALSTGIRNPDIYYNLGNAYFKSKKIGKAVLCYERGLALLPRDRDLMYNLEYAKSLLRDREPEQGLRALRAIYYFLTLNELAVITSFFYYIAAGSQALFLLQRKEIYLWLLVLSGVLFLLFGSVLAGRTYQHQFQHFAIVQSATAEARTGPGQDNPVAFVAHEGAKVKILREERSWLEVAFFGQARGWMQEKDMERI